MRIPTGWRRTMAAGAGFTRVMTHLKAIIIIITIINIIMTITATITIVTIIIFFLFIIVIQAEFTTVCCPLL